MIMKDHEICLERKLKGLFTKIVDMLSKDTQIEIFGCLNKNILISSKFLDLKKICVQEFFPENRGWFKNTFNDFLIGNYGNLRKII